MIKRISHIEFYLSHMSLGTIFCTNTLKFNKVEYLGDDLNHVTSGKHYFMNSYNANIILTAPDSNIGIVQHHLTEHNDSVKDVGFIVKNVDSIVSKAKAYGAQILITPRIINIEGNNLYIARISAFGDVTHTIIQENSDEKILLSHLYKESTTNSTNKLLNNIDHIAVCLNNDQLDWCVNYYSHVFSMRENSVEYVDTGSSGMISKVMTSGNNKVKIVLAVAMEKYKKSQIIDFIMTNHGPGIQHVAFETNDIIRTVSNLTTSGLSFLHIPSSYYDLCLTKFPELKAMIEKLQPLNILLDKDKDGYLFQCFTKPLGIRSAFFIEVIQRAGSKGFGTNNIRMLFKAIEMHTANTTNSI